MKHLLYPLYKIEIAYPLKYGAGFHYELCKFPHRTVLLAEETKQKTLTAAISSGILGGMIPHYPPRMDQACPNFIWLCTKTPTHCLTL